MTRETLRRSSIARRTGAGAIVGVALALLSLPVIAYARETAGRGAAASPRAEARVFFLRGERLAPVRRLIARPAAAAGAVRALLAGPTPAERARGLVTAIPAGTKLRGLSLRGGTATADLTRRFESGGGTLSMQARLAQLVYTLTFIPTIDRVSLRLDGRPVRVFGGEGIVLDRPLARADFRAFAPAG